MNSCIPKAIVGDEAFFSDEFNEYYKFHGIKALPCGPRTPWPNRAETAVRLFKRQWSLMTQSLEGDERFSYHKASSEDDCLGQEHTVNH